MISHRTLAVLAAAALCAFAPATPQGPPTSAAARRLGWALGTWELPFAAQNGYVDGLFYSRTPAPTVTPAYHFTADLVAAPVLCPNCVAGSLQGVLDDGIGPAPDYLVVGTYYGTWSTGSGSFVAHIYRPTSAAPVGYVVGNFSDPPLLPVLGHFDGKWALRN